MRFVKISDEWLQRVRGVSLMIRQEFIKEIYVKQKNKVMSFQIKELVGVLVLLC
jgi:hypothetical protein